MKLNDFKTLSQLEQCELLLSQAVYIGKLKRSGTACSLLYQLDAFYVELTYRKYRYFIAGIRYFDSPQQLDEYIEQVPLNDLIFV